ncbi:MAG: cupin domain-containing protein [bacterium]|nr:cupin domain-containing protein [bacterium]
MKIQKNIGFKNQWLFTDGSVPIQVRLIHAHEIRKEEHLHKTMHEYFYLLQGAMKISIDGEILEMEPDDLVIVEPGERHVIVDASDDLQLLLLMPPPVPNDKVVVSSE